MKKKNIYSLAQRIFVSKQNKTRKKEQRESLESGTFSHPSRLPDRSFPDSGSPTFFNLRFHMIQWKNFAKQYASVKKFSHIKSLNGKLSTAKKKKICFMASLMAADINFSNGGHIS